MNKKNTVISAASFMVALGFSASCLAQAAPATNGAPAFRPELIYQPRGNYSNNVARPLRYWPVGTDFVITNGVEFFNRPLYSMNSGFRIDGGDKPEFSLYLPGRGGNLRLGIKTAAGVKWLNDARQIVTRYRPGSLLYAIHDPLLGNGELDVAVLPLADTKGFIVRAELRGAAADLFMAYGGANGMRGSRDGDIGCERQPVSEFFQMQPEQCRSNVFSIAANTFKLRDNKTIIAGVLPSGAKLFVADAPQWNSPASLLASAAAPAALPVVVGEVAVKSGRPVYLALQQLSRDGQQELPVYRDVSKNNASEPAAGAVRRGLPGVRPAESFRRGRATSPRDCGAGGGRDARPVHQCRRRRAEHRRRRRVGRQAAGVHARRGRVADAAARLARTLCTGDELGWHDRTAEHFAGFAKNQNAIRSPQPFRPPDEQFNLARSEAALHSNGDMSHNHITT